MSKVTYEVEQETVQIKFNDAKNWKKEIKMDIFYLFTPKKPSYMTHPPLWFVNSDMLYIFNGLKNQYGYSVHEKSFLGYGVVVDESEDTVRFGDYEKQVKLEVVQKPDEQIAIETEIKTLQAKLSKIKYDNKIGEIK